MNEEIEKLADLLVRVYGDLQAADDFVGITPEQIMKEKALGALFKAYDAGYKAAERHAEISYGIQNSKVH